MRLKSIFVVLFLLSCLTISAQKISVSTNVLDYMALGTLNVETSVALSRHWSVVAAVKYNPFTFRKSDVERQFQLRQQSYSLGARFWPWHIWSGWWLAAGFRYQEYNSGGLFSRDTREGDRLGAGIYSGYTHMLSPHFNIEFGAGVWGGLDIYRIYDCPVCGVTSDAGRRYFVLPGELKVAVAYVF